jgi:D-alanyl-D-alanine carboxypeptidase
MGGTETSRWNDTRRLMDYAFNNFRFREIARENEIVEIIEIENPRLGDVEMLEIILNDSHTALLSHAEYASLSRRIIFDPILLVENEDSIFLRAPIEDGAVVGTISYIADGTVIFEAQVFSSREVIERSFDSDMDYYLAAFFGNIFTRRALPYWFGFFGTIFGISGIILAIHAHRRVSRKAVRTPEFRSRYSRYK